MANRISALAVDCIDGPAQAAFWCAVLDWVVTETDEYGNVSIAPRPDAGYGIDFLVVPDGPKTIKNRLHLDLNATDRTQDEELARLLEIGAVRTDIGQADDVSWVVLADPEGNEFCLLRSTVAPLTPGGG